MGLSTATLFAARVAGAKISKKTWSKLEQGEKAAAAGEYKQRGDNSPRLEETAPRFSEFLELIRGCREEAERLAGGDIVKARELFDSMLDAFVQTSGTTGEFRAALAQVLAEHQASFKPPPSSSSRKTQEGAGR